MDFKLIHLLYIVIILGIYCNLFTTRNMSERFNKGLMIQNSKLKKFLWMRKTDDYVSFVSIVFLIIAYFTLIAALTGFVICLFVSDVIAQYISWILGGFTFIMFFIEHFFLPPYGVRGS